MKNPIVLFYQVAVVGGSYSATMATWARLKYPHLIDAAYASSAPLRAVADFFGKINPPKDNHQNTLLIYRILRGGQLQLRIGFRRMRPDY